MLVKNHKVLKYGGKWIGTDNFFHYITIVQTEGGTITASTMKATPGTVITLSNVTDPGYTFDYYTINGEPLVGNTFIMGDEEVIVSASYIHNIRTIYIEQSTGGTVTATPSTGYYGTEVTLTVETASGYIFDSYSVTGTTIINDKFIIGEEDVYIKPNYEVNYNPLNLPPYTIRLKYAEGTTPTFSRGTGVLVDSTNNIWDLTYENTNWSSLLQSHTNLLEVLGANTSNVTAMTNMFNSCTSLTSVSLFDTSNVTYMISMFYNCSSLTTVPLFNTSNLTSMSDMFNGCTSLTTVPLFDTSNVLDMTYMLRDCSSLTSVPLFDTSNVTDMYGMLIRCTSLTTVPLFDTSNVTAMNHMFNGCSSLSSVPLLDTSNVTNMDEMLRGCTSLTTVPLFDTTNVTSMGWMFYDCTSLTTVPLFNTSNVSSMGLMFYNCYSLTTVPLFDTSNLTIMGRMFYNCSSLSSIPLFDTSKVTNMYYTFYNCYNVQSGALALYQQASTQTTPPTDHRNTFTNCGRDTTTGAAELAQIPSSWGGTGA